MRANSPSANLPRVGPSLVASIRHAGKCRPAGKQLFEPCPAQNRRVSPEGCPVTPDGCQAAERQFTTHCHQAVTSQGFVPKACRAATRRQSSAHGVSRGKGVKRSTQPRRGERNFSPTSLDSAHNSLFHNILPLNPLDGIFCAPPAIHYPRNLRQINILRNSILKK